MGTVDGPVKFGIEETGRYGGIDKPVGEFTKIDCKRASDVLRKILDTHSRIDLLKIDIEGSERPVLESLGPEITEHVETIYAETRLTRNPLHATHE